MTTPSETEMRTKLLELYPDMQPSGMCSHHQQDGPLSCRQCYPNYRALCEEHAKVSDALRQELEEAKATIAKVRRFTDALEKVNDDQTEMEASLCCSLNEAMMHDVLDATEVERNALRAELDALRADKERLDWLEKNTTDKNPRFAHDVYATWEVDKSLRSAIDAARKERP